MIVSRYVDDPINDFDLDGTWGWKNIKKWTKKAISESAGFAAKTAAAAATSVRGTVHYVNRHGSTILKSFDTRVPGLSPSALGAIAGGVAQGVADAFRGGLSATARVGRISLAAGAAAGGAALAGAVCVSGGCQIAVALVAGYGLYKGASYLSTQAGWGSM